MERQIHAEIGRGSLRIIRSWNSKKNLSAARLSALGEELSPLKIQNFDSAGKSASRERVQEGSAHVASPGKAIGRLTLREMKEKERAEKVRIRRNNQEMVMANKMFEAIKTNQWNRLNALCSRIESLETKDEDGNTFLSVAVQTGNPRMVRFLVESGANINTQNKAGNTPLHYAKAYRYIIIMHFLLGNGAIESIQNNRKKTAWEGI